MRSSTDQLIDITPTLITEGGAEVWWKNKSTSMVIRLRRGIRTPLGVFHGSDQAYHVLEGEVRVCFGYDEWDVKAGRSIIVPSGQPFVLSNENSPLVLLIGEQKNSSYIH